MTTTYIINRTHSSALEFRSFGLTSVRLHSFENFLLYYLLSSKYWQVRAKVTQLQLFFYFFGNPKGVNWYKLWARDSRGSKIIASRNVTFNESSMPCLNRRSSKRVFEKGKVRGTKLQVEIESTPDFTNEI